jgi:hypothetical protein
MKKLGLFLLFLCFQTSLLAIDNNTQEITKLNTKINDLEKRLEHIEKFLVESTVVLPNENSLPSKIENSCSNNIPSLNPWNNLATGMSKEQVVKLIGQPLRTSGNGSFLQWYYSDSYFSKIVVFYNDLLDRWEP